MAAVLVLKCSDLCSIKDCTKMGGCESAAAMATSLHSNLLKKSEPSAIDAACPPLQVILQVITSLC